MTFQSAWIRKGFFATMAALVVLLTLLVASRAWSMSDENARLLDQAQWHAEDELEDLNDSAAAKVAERFKQVDGYDDDSAAKPVATKSATAKEIDQAFDYQ